MKEYTEISDAETIASIREFNDIQIQKRKLSMRADEIKGKLLVTLEKDKNYKADNFTLKKRAREKLYLVSSNISKLDSETQQKLISNEVLKTSKYDELTIKNIEK